MLNAESILDRIFQTAITSTKYQETGQISDEQSYALLNTMTNIQEAEELNESLRQKMRFIIAAAKETPCFERELNQRRSLCIDVYELEQHASCSDSIKHNFLLN